MKTTRHAWPCPVAWGLVIVAIVFWFWFGIGSAYAEDAGAFNWLMHILIPGGIFLVTAGIAKLWKVVGGALFTLQGIFVSSFVVLSVVPRPNVSLAILLLLTLALPPLLAGIMFLLCWWEARRESK